MNEVIEYVEFREEEQKRKPIIVHTLNAQEVLSYEVYWFLV